ncbi:MAG: hypothetical protein ACF8Q5_07805 [Phycisphaerales bacterium JB040]
MDDGFIDSPDAPLPTTGVFHTEYSEKLWWRHIGGFCLFEGAIVIAVCTTITLTVGGNQRPYIVFTFGGVFVLLMFCIALLYRQTRARHERITIDWESRKIEFAGHRSNQADLLDRRSTGVTIGFDEILDARRESGRRTLPNCVFVRAREYTVTVGLYHDQMDGLLARLNRIGKNNPKPSTREVLRKFWGSPIALFFILLIACFVIGAVVFVLTT